LENSTKRLFIFDFEDEGEEEASEGEGGEEDEKAQGAEKE
jgi:hypothetical protein